MARGFQVTSQLYRITTRPIQLESRMNRNLWFSKVYETHLQEYMEWSSQIREYTSVRRRPPRYGH